MPKTLDSGRRKSRKVIIGEEFPITDVITGTRLYVKDFTRCLIALCLIFIFVGLAVVGAVFSLWTGDYKVFLTVWGTVQSFVGIMIGYYFGRHGHGGRGDKDNDASTT